MRIFYVCSFGGCASTMLCKLLARKYTVFHIHSRYPPKMLTTIRRTKLSREPEWFNYKKVIRNKKIVDNITVIYLYRKPSSSLLSHDGWGMYHFNNIGLNINDVRLRKYFSKSEDTRLKYSLEKNDILGLRNFFENYVFCRTNMNYDIVCLKYETLWDNLEEIFEKLDISKDLLDHIPKKYSKERSAKQLKTIENLKVKYKDLEDIMDKLPPIFINHRHRR